MKATFIKSKLLLGCAAVIGLAAATVQPARATPVVWNFTPTSSGALGSSSHVYSSSPTLSPAENITATGYHFDTTTQKFKQVGLYGKNGGSGSGEQGLGLVNDPSGDHEISFGNFIQLDLFALHSPPLTSTHLSFQANSTTGGETWIVYGTNTAGTLTGATLLDSGKNNSDVADLGPAILGTYRYLDVTVASQGQNVLLRQIDNSVPEPASLALLGAGLIGLGMVRRRRNLGSAVC